MRPPAEYDDGNVAEVPAMPSEVPERVLVCSSSVGRDIIKVVMRCEDARENSELDLSKCRLMHVPDAVYHLMRHTELKTCDLSGNTITKITPKFAVKFNLITELNLSSNQMARLPDELTSLANLERLDISHNSFVQLPYIVPRIPSLKIVLAHHNSIIEVDVDRLKMSSALEEVDLQNNPIPAMIHSQLLDLKKPMVLLSEREKEDWEDLTI